MKYCLIVASMLDEHDEMINKALMYINGDSRQYRLINVTQAYMRTDPNRGLDYHLTVKLRDTHRLVPPPDRCAVRRS